MDSARTGAKRVRERRGDSWHTHGSTSLTRAKNQPRWSMEDECQSDSCNMLIMTARKQEETYYA
jgi:hypothetical protein